MKIRVNKLTGFANQAREKQYSGKKSKKMTIRTIQVFVNLLLSFYFCAKIHRHSFIRGGGF